MTPSLTIESEQIIMITYVDECADLALSTLTPFTLFDMETSVLRAVTEVTEPFSVSNLPDLE